MFLYILIKHFIKTLFDLFNENIIFYTIGQKQMYVLEISLSFLNVKVWQTGIMLSVVMLNVIMLSVVILSDVAPNSLILVPVNSYCGHCLEAHA